MGNFNLNSKVIIKLNEKGKQLYYLGVLNNEMDGTELQNDGNLIAPFQKVMNLLGDVKQPINTVLESEQLYIVETGKSVLLDTMIYVQLSDYGKQVYYLSTMDTHDAKTLVSRDDYLLLSIRDLIRIFGDHLEALPFDHDDIMLARREEQIEESQVKNR